MTGRQRGTGAAAFFTALVLAVLALASGCEARSSVEAAQTAVVAAQTALPGAQATAQAGATLVSIAVSTAQPLVTTLQGLMGGAAVQVHITPEGADAKAVTSVDIEGTDQQGTLGQIDASTRQAAVTAALLAAAQYYPNATITLKVEDASGAALVSGSLAPGQTPSVQ
jgi:hypothetical protein